MENRKHKHLSAIERGRIAELHEQGYTAYAIGKKLGRASNTIRNELRRGTTHQYDSRRNKDIYVYFPETGYLRYKKNRCKSVHHYKKDYNDETSKFIDEVTELVLHQKYSLDSAVHFVLKKETYKKEDTVCVRTMYNYVEHGIIQIKNIDLPYKVGRKKKKAKPPAKRQYGRSIDERSEKINKREDFGHWEIDLVIGKKQNDNVLLTLTERKTRKEIIRKVRSKQTEDIKECLKSILNKMPKYVFKTITSDNGVEFAKLYEFEKDYDIKIYYAHPYASYERGSNENGNRLIRRHTKKGKAIKLLNKGKIQYIEDWMNNMPRRIFDYQSSNEMYEKEIKNLTG